MPDRYGSYPPDEPIIGETRTSGPANVPAELPYDDYDDEGYADEPYDDEYGDDDGPAYYDDDYYDDSPARQPIFYAFVALAVLVGAAAIFILLSLVRTGDDDASPTVAPGSFKVQLVSPKNGDRQKTGQSFEIVVRADSSEPLARFELLVGESVVDQAPANPPATGTVYSATLKTQFDKRGDYTLFVKAVAVSGASKETERIKLTAIEEPGDRPVSVKGKVVATVSLRTGPGDEFEQAGTLEPGTEVKIVGKTRDNEWLLLDIERGRWARRSGIQEADSLALVPVREAGGPATPAPTVTPSPSATASPSPGGNVPDFSPVDARMVFGGSGRTSLRISIRNEGSTYAGPLVVGLTTVPAGLVSPQQAFDVNIGPGKTATVDFDVTGQLPAKTDVTVRVDPANAIKEASKDNNTTTFKGVTAPADPPDVVVGSVTVQPGASGAITVTVLNNGGNLGQSEIRVKVTIGSSDASQVKNQALNKAESTNFSFQKFATGSGRVEVFINGVPTASANIDVPAAQTGTPAASPTAGQ